ncbi:hypothetical protein J7E77_04455 [Bacillus sp. ISL-77]|nr:hypothetical protein [Bacillus sp. ISL-77]MBT2739946.1 hypothetical protein [Bacillus sp. ISL-77]
MFKAEFCNPVSGNEKVRVEGAVGYVRRNALVPLPEVQSVNELNDYLLDWCLKEPGRTHVPNKSETVLEMWEKEKEYLHPFQRTVLKLVSFYHAKLIKLPLLQWRPIVILYPAAMWVKLYGQKFLSIV